MSHSPKNTNFINIIYRHLIFFMREHSIYILNKYFCLLSFETLSILIFKYFVSKGFSIKSLNKNSTAFTAILSVMIQI